MPLSERIVDTPARVELVASTRIHWYGVSRVLRERGLEWIHEGPFADASGGRAGDVEGDVGCFSVLGSDAALLAEFAGRHCYNSFGGENGAGMGRKTNADYIGHIIETGHFSVFEHASFTFHIWGCSRGFTHEAVRHRAGTAYSQASTRFRDESRFGRFVMPPKLRGNRAAKAAAAAVLVAAEAGYKAWRILVRDSEADIEGIPGTSKVKAARGAARSLLPIGLESPITITMNVRAVRNFLDQRASEWAEAEIREVAMEVYRIVSAEAEVLVADYTVVTLADGTEALRRTTGGH